MKDEAEQKAAALLPCDCGGVYEGGGKVNPDRHAGPLDESYCPAYFRPAVSAAIREAQDAEIAKLEKELIAESQECGRLRAKIAKLKAQGTEFDEDFNRIKAERDAAYVRGLERARRIADEIELMTVDYGIERAIADEIDKAKAGKL